MRTTVTLDDDVFEAAQSQARASGMSLGKVLSQMARRGLRTESAFASKNGLPVFRVPVDAPVIPGDRARALLAEDSE